MNKSGIDKAVIFPFPLEEEDSTAANEYVLDSALTFPDRFLPFALLDPEPEKWIERGALGFKQHFLLAPERFELTRIYRSLEEHQVPLIAHFTTGKALEQVQNILKAAPGLTLIVAHMGRQVPNTGEGILPLARELKSFENIFFETSTVCEPDSIRHTADIVGGKRILFGSDYPFNSDIRRDPILYEIDVINKSFTDTEIIGDVFSNNIKSILNIA